MQISFILPFYSRRPIGGLRVIYELANHLDLRGHDVTVVHPSRLAASKRRWTFRGIVNRAIDKVVALGGVSWMDVNRDVRLLHVGCIDDLSVPDADVIVATNWETARPTWDLSSSKGRKHYIVQDFYPYIAAKSDLEATWRLGFRMIAVSRWLEEMIIAAGVSAGSVSNISEGVSAKHRLTNPIEARQPSVALMYGTAAYKARHDALIALAAVRASLGPFPVRMFGPNFARRPADLPEWAEYRGLLSDEDIGDLYNRSAVFISSSLAEGFCMPASEAMASGCAVAATDSGGIRDFAIDSFNCLLSPPRRIPKPSRRTRQGC